jgi:hypothetical protein
MTLLETKGPEFTPTDIAVWLTAKERRYLETLLETIDRRRPTENRPFDYLSQVLTKVKEARP